MQKTLLATIAVLTALYATAPGQNRSEVLLAFEEVDRLIDIAKDFSGEAKGQELSTYVEKKLRFIEPQLELFRGLEQTAADTDTAKFRLILDVLTPHSSQLKQLISLANLYIRTDFLLERNLDAIDRAEEMVAPDNYLGLNQIQGAKHFYSVHAVTFGIEKQKQIMESETESQAVKDGAPLQAAADNSKRSMEFVQKAMVIARDEANARRFIDLVDRGFEKLEELEALDENFFEEVEEQYAVAEETYSLNNFKLASRQYEDLLKKINQHLITHNTGSVTAISVTDIRENRLRKKMRSWSKPISYTIKGGTNFFSVPKDTIDQETLNRIASETSGNTDDFRTQKTESPWSYFTGMEIAKKGTLGGSNRYMLDNYAEWSSYSLSDKLTGQFLAPSLTLLSLNEIRHYTNFQQSSFLRNLLKLNHKLFLSDASDFHWSTQLLGEQSFFYKDTSDDGPSFIRGSARGMLVWPFGASNEAGIGLAFENKTLDDKRRNYNLYSLPMMINARLGKVWNLWWTGSPALRNYVDDVISDRYSLLSYGILSYEISARLNVSLMDDMEYILYQKNASEFRRHRLQHLSTIRLNFSGPSLSAALEYSFDVIGNSNATDDSLYHFNLNENQQKNRIGINGYWIAYKTINYNLKVSTGIATGIVHHTFEQDDFYRNMVISQDYLSVSQMFNGKYGLDISFTFDGGWDRSGFFNNNYILIRKNSFFGVNFYARL